MDFDGEPFREIRNGNFLMILLHLYYKTVQGEVQEKSGSQENKE